MGRVQRVTGYQAALTELAQLDKSDVDAALRRILQVAAATIDVARVSYWDLAADHSQITCHSLFERDRHTFSSGAVLSETAFPAYFAALVQSRTIVAVDACNDPRTAEFAETYFKIHDIRAMLDIPVWRRGRLAGVLCHEHVGGTRAWTGEEQAFATGVANMISVALEASDRRHAEEGYALIARATNDVLWDWDMRSGIIDWNEALESVFHWRLERVGTSVKWWLERVHPDDRVRVRDKLADMFTSERSSYTDQYRWQRADGTYATVIDRGYIVRDGDRAPVRMIVSMLDVSERVELQARMSLSERMVSIGTLAAGVAHEINNPLTYVAANLIMALEDLDAGRDDVATQRERIAEALEGADRIRRVVRDLQVFSRPSDDDIQDIDVPTVIESSISIAFNEVRHRAQLVRDFQPIRNVRMNGAQLGQVVLNVIVNAAHAIKEGSVDANEITITTRTSEVGESVIQVTDTGAGIPADIQRRIFEPFFTTKPVGFGTGLGLSICHSIITKAGGTIEVDSTVGKGTTFTIRLPGVARPVPLPEVVPVKTARRRILVVDDDAILRRTLSRLLSARHDIVVAEHGLEAIEKLRADPAFDFVLCDIMMPMMTGMDVYRHLANENPHIARRIIFMTGGAFSSDSAEFLRTTPQPVLEKPLSRDQLDAAIEGLETAAPRI